MKPRSRNPVYLRIRAILEAARVASVRSVNTSQVVANWLIGREIVEDEQKGQRKAGYGEALLERLAGLLAADFGSGYSETNLRWFRQFYVEYESLLPREIHHAPRDKSAADSSARHAAIHHALRDKSIPVSAWPVILQMPQGRSWKPGRLHPNLSWTHYRTLLRVDKPEARAFYEIEAIKNNWAAREMERQINSLLYERLALSRDRKGLMRLALKGHEVAKPLDVFKDPVVMEFLGLPESPRLVETDLEQALISNLQTFLLELGKGFAFVARQERLTLDGDHFYIDLVKNEDEVLNVVQYHQQALVNLIHAQMQDHFEEKATAFEPHVSKGFTTLRPNNYSAPAGEIERDFRAPVTDKQDIRKMLFAGFRKCLYRVQKFDSDSERRFAVVLENDKEVLKWFKPAKGDFRIHYAGDASYEPDFVLETSTAKFLCEPKSAADMQDSEVIVKANSAAEWCKHATEHERKHGGKSWTYLLIPHDVIADNKTLQGLAATYTWHSGAAPKR